jgi:hypothetical protein
LFSGSVSRVRDDAATTGRRLEVLALIDGRRVAVELTYLLRDLTTTVEDELFELPFQSAQDVRRYDFVKDLRRLKFLLADVATAEGFAISSRTTRATGRAETARMSQMPPSGAAARAGEPFRYHQPFHTLCAVTYGRRIWKLEVVRDD